MIVDFKPSLLLGLAGVLLPLVADASDLERAKAALQTQLQHLSSQAGFPPGAVAAFALPDGQVDGAATGWADVEERIPMSDQGRLLGASTGKTFAAMLVLGLAQEGVLDLDDRIESWIGSEPWFGRLPNSSAITIRQLLNHTSGLPDHVFTWAFGWEIGIRAITGRGDVPFSPVDLIGFVLDREPIDAAGARYSYSDTGYILLGLIVERATGSSYYELVQERFLGPLDLSGTLPSDRPEIPGLAAGYVEPLCWLPSIKTVAGGALLVNPASEWTGGGFATNAKDLARWTKLVFEDRVLPGPYLDVMLSSKTPVREGVFYMPGGFVYETSLGRAFGHGGWIPGYTVSTLYFPDHRLAVAIQLNSDCGVLENRAMAYALAIAQAVLESQDSRRSSAICRAQLTSTLRLWRRR